MAGGDFDGLLVMGRDLVEGGLQFLREAIDLRVGVCGEEAGALGLVRSIPRGLGQRSRGGLPRGQPLEGTCASGGCGLILFGLQFLDICVVVG